MLKSVIRCCFVVAAAAKMLHLFPFGHPYYGTECQKNFSLVIWIEFD